MLHSRGIAQSGHLRKRRRRRVVAAFAAAEGGRVAGHRIYTTSFASVYPHYVAKAEKKGRTKAEVDEIISWLTGYSREALQAKLDAGADFATFFAEAPAMNPARSAITGTICGVRIEAIDEPLMREIRYLDRLVDELARGRPMAKILRGP